MKLFPHPKYVAMKISIYHRLRWKFPPQYLSRAASTAACMSSGQSLKTKWKPWSRCFQSGNRKDVVCAVRMLASILIMKIILMSKSNSIYISICVWPSRETCLLFLIPPLEESFLFLFSLLLLPPRDSRSQRNSCFEALDGCIMFSKINIFSALVTTSNIAS